MRRTAPEPVRDRSRRALATVVVVGAAAAYTLLRGTWPDIYTFATDPAASLATRLLTAPVHLADDVMLTLRSGEMILQTGAPAFNRTDLAQASTSYLAPYLFAGLRLLLPANLAAAAFAVAGFAAVLATFALIMTRARSLINGAILVAALALTTTNLEYALSGWDHLLQGLFFALGIVLALGRPPHAGRLVAISLLAAGGALTRPDGLLISVALLWVALMRSDVTMRRRLVAAIVPFAVVTVGMLALNYAQFGFLTPTTARLKAGAAPSLGYVKDYFIGNSVQAYTALSLLLVLFVVTVAFHRVLTLATVVPLAVAALATAAVATVNSDFFPGGRMFWVPAVVMAITLALTLPGLLRAGPAFALDDEGRIMNRMSTRAQWVVVLVLVALAVAGSTVAGLQRAVVSKEEVAGMRTAQQYIASEWADANLDPADGSVGVFFAGVADHLMDFEAADFLGKADEAIATTQRKWGPPGHNKWDIDATLAKWRPQLILPTIDQDPNDPSSDAIAADWRANQRTHGYIADLLTSDVVRSEYRYCRVPDPTGRTDEAVDVLLRVDIAEAHVGEVTCS